MQGREEADEPHHREQVAASDQVAAHQDRRQRHATRLLDQCDQLPGGNLRLALLREAARVARSCADERIEYGARLRLAAAASRSGLSGELLDNIEWCLERHLDDPEYFEAQIGTVDLAVEFAAVPGTLAARSDFSLATIDQSLAELRELLDDRVVSHRTAGGPTISGPSASRPTASEPTAAEPSMEERAARSRAEAKSLGDRARLEVFEATGMEREASALRSKLARARMHHPPDVSRRFGGDAGSAAASPDVGDPPVQPGSLSAATHPLLAGTSVEREIAESLLPALDSGQLSDAYLEHLRGYGLIAADPKYLDELALHIDFCAESGTLDRGLLLIERHLGWLAGEHHSEQTRFEALAAIAGLLDLVCERDLMTAGERGGSRTGGGGTMSVPSAPPPGGAAALPTRITAAEHPDLRTVLQLSATPATAQTLADACWGAALELARALDDRNGNDCFRARLSAAQARSDERCDDFSDEQWRRLPAPGSTAPGSAVQRPAAFRMLDDTASFSSEDWLRAARERASVEDPVGALWALYQAHEAVDRENSGAARGRDVSARSLARPKRDQAGVGPNRADAAERTGAKKDRRGHSARARNSSGLPQFDDLVAGQAADRAGNDTPRSGGSDAPPSVKPALYELEIRLAVEQGDYARAEKLAGWRVDQLIADDRLDLAEVELELGLLLFGVTPERRRGDLERELTAARQNGLQAEAVVSILNALGELRLTQQRPREAVEFLLSSVSLCGHDPDSSEVQRPLVLLAHAQVALEQPEWARATLDRLLRHDLDRAMRAKALLLRATVLQLTGDARAAVEDADRSLSLSLELRYRGATVEACATLASLLEQLGVHSGVVEAWRMAVTEASNAFETPAAEHPQPPAKEHPDLLGLQFRLAQALLASERGREATDELNRVFEGSGQRDAGERADVLFWLGHAYRVDDRDETAYAVWNLALQLASEVQDARSAVRTSLALGRLLLDNDDAECLPVLQHALALSRSIADGIPIEVDALHLLAIAQCAFGHAEGLQTFDRAVELAGDNSFDIDALLANVTESRARALDSLGRDDEALQTSADAARLYERLGNRASAGQAHLFTARLLVTQGRYAEALPVYRRSLDYLPLDAPVVQVAADESRMVGERVQTAALAAGTPLSP